VRALHIVSKSDQKYCSNTYIIDAYIEHPKNRLNDFSDFPYPDSLYLLRAMLSGYAKLFHHVGQFPVKEEQVCIDEGGEVRVWLNEDLSKNFPEEWEIEPRFRLEDEEEQEMVMQIVEVVARNSDHDEEPKPTFEECFKKRKQAKRMGFKETIMLIEEFAVKNGSEIPNYFTSVVGVYQDQDQLCELPNLGYLDECGSLNNYSNEEERNYLGEAEGERDDFSERGRRKCTIQRGSFRSNKESGSSKSNKSNRYSNVVKLRNHSLRQSVNADNYLKCENKNEGETYRLSGLSRLDDNYSSRSQQ
jgi:hypothetical protein